MNLGPSWYPSALVLTALRCAWLGGALLELLVVEELRVDRDDATLALLLQRHLAVDGREHAVAPELGAVDPDQLHQPVLEGVRGQWEIGAERHGGGRHRGVRIDAEGLRKLLRLLDVQTMLPVQRRRDVHRVLGADRLAEVVVREALGLAALTDLLERRCPVHGVVSFQPVGTNGREPSRPSARACSWR